MLNLAHRDSREDPAPLEPGVPTRVRIPLEVTSWTFDAGTPDPPGPRGLGLAERVVAAARRYTLTIDRASAVLTLPVMDGPSPVAERPVARAAARHADATRSRPATRPTAS